MQTNFSSSHRIWMKMRVLRQWEREWTRHYKQLVGENRLFLQLSTKNINTDFPMCLSCSKFFSVGPAPAWIHIISIFLKGCGGRCLFSEHFLKVIGWVTSKPPVDIALQTISPQSACFLVCARGVFQTAWFAISSLNVLRNNIKCFVTFDHKDAVWNNELSKKYQVIDQWMPKKKKPLPFDWICILKMLFCEVNVFLIRLKNVKFSCKIDFPLRTQSSFSSLLAWVLIKLCPNLF